MKISPLSMILSAAILAVGLLPVRALASGYDDYEDDIYYNPATAKQKAKEQPVVKEERQPSAYVPNVVIDYADPALNDVGTAGLDVDVDAYNRRGQFLVADTVGMSAADAQNSDTYAYTRRIEKYHNEDIVNGSKDQTLIDSYYSTPATTDINVYVVNPSPWTYYGGGWYNPWNPWSWNSLYWNSWYWGPSWSFGIGWYDPWYSWSWGPGWGGPGWWSPGWGPAPGWRPGWGGPSWGPAPGWNGNHWASNSPGASRPHAPAGSIGSSSTNSRRPGAFSAGANTDLTRPGNSGIGSTRPSVSVPAASGVQQTRPSSGAVTVPTNRGRGNSNATSPNTSRQNQISTPSRTAGSSSSFRSSGSMGSHSTHGSTGGGGYSGGGSGSRGRR